MRAVREMGRSEGSQADPAVERASCLFSRASFFSLRFSSLSFLVSTCFSFIAMSFTFFRCRTRGVGLRRTGTRRRSEVSLGVFGTCIGSRRYIRGAVVRIFWFRCRGRSLAHREAAPRTCRCRGLVGEMLTAASAVVPEVHIPRSAERTGRVDAHAASAVGVSDVGVGPHGGSPSRRIQNRILISVSPTLIASYSTGSSNLIMSAMAGSLMLPSMQVALPSTSGVNLM